MGEAATDSTGKGRESMPDTTTVVNAQTNSLENSVENISKRQKSQENCLLVVYACIGVLVIMVILLMVKLTRVSVKRKQLRRDFEQFKQAPLSQEYVGFLEKKILAEVDRRMSKARKTVELRDDTRDSRQQAGASVAPTLRDSPVIRYFETNSNRYFVGVFKDSSPGTAFKVTFKNDSLEVGEFELTDLSKIKSADQIGQVVQLTDDSKKIKDAQNVIHQVNGTVVREGNLWKVVKKLKLKLS